MVRVVKICEALFNLQELIIGIFYKPSFVISFLSSGCWHVKILSECFKFQICLVFSLLSGVLRLLKVKIDSSHRNQWREIIFSYSAFQNSRISEALVLTLKWETHARMCTPANPRHADCGLHSKHALPLILTKGVADRNEPGCHP